jgi:lipopolysaccharide biosynthesis glycosyltransferase
MPDVLRLFVGYDRRETVAAHVAAFSFVRRSSVPVSVTLLMLPQLPMTRDRDERQSTDFAFSRFLVPSICGYEGRSLFVDCDVLCRVDVSELFHMIQPHHAVAVVKHEYTPKTERKFLDQQQTTYQRKNWSSVMVFNNALCRMLTQKYVNEASGLDLHQFRWLPDNMIGALDKSWNHLVGEYPENPNAKIVHFTLGTPCFEKYSDCEYAREWYEEKNAMLAYDRRGEYSRPERVEV